MNQPDHSDRLSSQPRDWMHIIGIQDHMEQEEVCLSGFSVEDRPQPRHKYNCASCFQSSRLLLAHSVCISLLTCAVAAWRANARLPLDLSFVVLPLCRLLCPHAGCDPLTPDRDCSMSKPSMSGLCRLSNARRIDLRGHYASLRGLQSFVGGCPLLLFVIPIPITSQRLHTRTS